MCTAAGKVPGYCCVAIFWEILAHLNYTSAQNLTLLCLRCFGKVPFACPGVHRISSFCELQCSSKQVAVRKALPIRETLHSHVSHLEHWCEVFGALPGTWYFRHMKQDFCTLDPVVPPSLARPLSTVFRSVVVLNFFAGDPVLVVTPAAAPDQASSMDMEP